MTRLFPAAAAAAALLLSPAALAADTGDLFVKVTEGQSGQIFVDGEDTGLTTPATIEDLPSGNHMVQVKGDCVSAVTQVDIAPNKLARAELDLQPLGGFVQITTTPSTASVTVDRALIQNNGQGMNVDCGAHDIQVMAPGYITQTRSLDVEMGQAYTLDFTLFPEGTGSLTVLVKPVEAAIYLDGHKVSDGPTTIDGVDAGSHRLEAFLDGYQPGEEQVELSSGETLEVKFELLEQGAAASSSASMSTTSDSGGGLNGKLLAGGGLAIVGTGLVIGGVASFSGAMEAYTYAQEELAPADYDQAVDHYNAEAVPRARRAYALWAVGGLAIAGGGTLMFIDDTPVLGISGRF